jgi:acetyl esterase/lipase
MKFSRIVWMLLTAIAVTAACGLSTPACSAADDTPDNKQAAERPAGAEKEAPASAQVRQWWPGAVPAGVKAYRDVEYARVGERPLLMDIFVPEKDKGPLPLVVWVHGGGWESGSRRDCKAAWLSGEGYVVASIDYRLSGEAPFPAQIHDCKAAIRWLRANAAKYKIDLERVGAWGSSAGAHLVNLLGTSGDVKELEGDLGPAGQSSRVQAVCSYYGPGNLVTVVKQRRVRNQTPADPFYKLLGGPVEEKQDLLRAASPVTYISKDDPPFLLVHGELDGVVPYAQSVEFDKALKAAGVSSTFRTVKGAGHGFIDETSDRMVAAFFNEHLKAKKKAPEGKPEDQDAEKPAPADKQ